MRAGAVIVDFAVDQGGCIEGIRETTHAEPVYDVHGVLHYAVGNIPAAVPHTSTYALTNATLPYAVALATEGVRTATPADPELAKGVNTAGGRGHQPRGRAPSDAHSYRSPRASWSDQRWAARESNPEPLG